jgi:hypothetical protein
MRKLSVRQFSIFKKPNKQLPKWLLLHEYQLMPESKKFKKANSWAFNGHIEALINTFSSENLRSMIQECK